MHASTYMHTSMNYYTDIWIVDHDLRKYTESIQLRLLELAKKKTIKNLAVKVFLIVVILQKG